MVGIGASEWVVVGGVLVAVVALAWVLRDVGICLELQLVDEADELETALFDTLSRVQGFDVSAGRGDYLLKERGGWGWALALLALLFPVGTFFAIVAFLTRRPKELRVVLIPVRGGGAVLRLTGALSASRWRRVSRAIASVARVRGTSDGALDLLPR